MRGKQIKIAGGIGAAVVALGLSLGACGTSTAGQSTGHRPPAATQQEDVASQQQQILDWYNKTGKTDLNNLKSDADTIVSDANNGDLSAMMDDGQAIADDSLTAENNPPPGDLAVPWVKAMHHEIAAGQALTDGNLTRATNQTNAASADMDTFSTLLKAEIGS